MNEQYPRPQAGEEDFSGDVHSARSLKKFLLIGYAINGYSALSSLAGMVTM